MSRRTANKSAGACGNLKKIDFFGSNINLPNKQTRQMQQQRLPLEPCPWHALGMCRYGNDCKREHRAFHCDGDCYLNGHRVLFVSPKGTQVHSPCPVHDVPHYKKWCIERMEAITKTIKNATKPRPVERSAGNPQRTFQGHYVSKMEKQQTRVIQESRRSMCQQARGGGGQHYHQNRSFRGRERGGYEACTIF